MGFYVESADRPYISYLAAEDIHVGTFVTENGSGEFRRTEAADSDGPDGLAVRPLRSDWIAFDEDDTLANEIYSASENDRVPAHPLEDGMLLKAHTAADNSTDPAPSISDGDVVGIAAVGGSEFEGRVVEEGYTDNGGTIYGRSSGGDFLALGVASVKSKDAIQRASDQYDEPVRLRYRVGL